jgi:hypothetical protein
MALRSALPLTLSLLAPILLTIFFALSLKATLTGNWVSRENWTTDTFPPEDHGTLHRSPFTTCSSNFGPVHAAGANTTANQWYEVCTRYARPGDSCDASPNGTDYPSFCQQVDLTARLLVVGCVFAGFAFVGSWAFWVLCVLDWRRLRAEGTGQAVGKRQHGRHRQEETVAAEEERANTSASGIAAPFSHRHHRHGQPLLFSYMSLPLRLFALIATVAAFLAAMIGGNALTNLNPPNSDFASGLAAETRDAGWRFDAGYTVASANWVVGAFGLWVVDLFWSTKGLELWGGIE